LKREEDGGLVPDASGKYVTITFPLITNSKNAKVRAKTKLVDVLYNSLRHAIKDTTSMSLRLEMQFPKQALRTGAQKSRAPLGGAEPVTEINKFGYNPALERRIKY